MNANFIIVHDCETGGLDPDENPITQYAAVILDPLTLDEVDRYETYVQPYCELEIDPQAIAATQVEMSDIKRGIPLDQFVKEVTFLYKSYQLKHTAKGAGRLISVGHNVQFDHGFLEYALGVKGINFWDYIMPNFIDTMTLAQLTWEKAFPKEKINLSNCVKIAKLDLTDAHGAMNDVEATADLFRYFTNKLRKRGSFLDQDDDKPLKKKEFFEFRCGQK